VSPICDFHAQGIARQSSFVSDVFHKLSQPLTALQCSLELSLARDRSLGEFRASVEAALHNAERLRQRLLLLRELHDADDPGDTSTPVQLQELLHDLQQDFLPVCESAGGCFTVSCEPVQVRGNGAKLRRAFFYLLEYLLRTSKRRSLNVTVDQANGRKVEIRLTVSEGRFAAPPANDASDTISTGELEIARRTFRAIGGHLAPFESAGLPTGWIASLPRTG
jgi:signal transduction histidine kinase